MLTSHTAFSDRSCSLKAIISQLLFYYINIWIKFMFEIPCIVTLYYIKNQQDATLAVLFMFEIPCIITLYYSYIKNQQDAVVTDLGHPHWIYIILTHGMHQWLLLQFLVLLMMDEESVRNM